MCLPGHLGRDTFPPRLSLTNCSRNYGNHQPVTKLSSSRRRARGCDCLRGCVDIIRLELFHVRIRDDGTGVEKVELLGSWRDEWTIGASDLKKHHREVN